MRLHTTLPTALLALLPQSLAQEQHPNDRTSSIAKLDTSSTILATATLSPQNPTRLELRQETQPTASSQPATTSVLQATRTESYSIPQASTSSTLDENGIDVEAGASGSSSGGFTLSKGGLIAVIVVVVCVAVFGVLSITLFILAKKRQWRLRESIKRASRRLTGRSPGPRPRSEVDRRKRSGVIAGRRPAGRAPPSTPLVPEKGGAVSETEMRDLEKGGKVEGGDGKGRGWMGKMKGNDWR